MHDRPSTTPSTHALRFVRALALGPALAGCPPEREAPPPVLIEEGSSGGVDVQGGVVQGNTVVVQRNNGADQEQNVEMRTVVVGQPAACVVGQIAVREPGQRCACVATSAGPQWQCAAVEQCALGSVEQRPGQFCRCEDTGSGAAMRCVHLQDDHYRRPVGPLPPPELSERRESESHRDDRVAT